IVLAQRVDFSVIVPDSFRQGINAFQERGEGRLQSVGYVTSYLGSKVFGAARGQAFTGALDHAAHVVDTFGPRPYDGVPRLQHGQMLLRLFAPVLDGIKEFTVETAQPRKHV